MCSRDSRVLGALSAARAELPESTVVMCGEGKEAQGLLLSPALSWSHRGPQRAVVSRELGSPHARARSAGATIRDCAKTRVEGQMEKQEVPESPRKMCGIKLK